MIPILMICYNRLSYTKIAIKSLYDDPDTLPFVVDNNSEDGTAEYLQEFQKGRRGSFYYNKSNLGIAGAFNLFLEHTAGFHYVGKVDNDTKIPKNFIAKMLPHMAKAQLVQAKHHLIEASEVGTFDQWVSKMPADGALRFNHFVGGSGVLMKRQLIDRIPETENKLMGWRQWQKEHPEVKKAFATDVEIELLDAHGYGDFPEYYAKTGRL